MKKVRLEKITNRIILEMTPVDYYAKVLDENIPSFLFDMIEWLENADRNQMRSVFDTSFLRNWPDEYLQEHKQELLPYLVDEFISENDAAYKYFNSISDDEFDDIIIYLYFFSQYRIVTNEDLKVGTSFEDILITYRQLGKTFLDKYVFLANYVPGKGKVSEFDFVVIINDKKVEEFEELASGLDLYVSEEKKNKYDALQKNKVEISEVKHLSNCNAFKYYMDRNYDYAWMFDSDCHFRWEEKKRQEEIETEELNFPPPFESSLDEEYLSDDDPFDITNYNLDQRLSLLYQNTDNYEHNDDAMTFASRYFDCVLYEHLPFNENEGTVAGIMGFINDYDESKIADAAEMYLSIEINHICEELALLTDRKEKMRVLEAVESRIEEILRSIVCDISLSNEKRIARVDSLKCLSEWSIKQLLFSVYSSKDMQYILLNQFRLNKDEESFIRLLFCVCYDTSYLFLNDALDFLMDKVELIDIYEMIVKKIIDYYTPVLKAIDRYDEMVKFEKINNPYGVYDDIGMIALYSAQLDKGELNHSDMLLIQEHIYICANMLDLFSMILGINTILTEDAKGNNTFLTKNQYKRVRDISNEYRHFFLLMIDHIFEDYSLTEDYLMTQAVKTIEDKEEKIEEYKKVNILFQGMMESLQSILDSDTVDPQEIADNKQIILKMANMLGLEWDKIDQFIDKLIVKLTKLDIHDAKYIEFYVSIERELKTLYSEIDLSIIKTLATAEYFYSIYIEEKKEIENFDYSCFSILYYRCLEDALNSYLYIPYKQAFEQKAIEQIEMYGENDYRADIVVHKVNGLICYSKRDKEYYLNERLPLGGLAYFCRNLYNSNNSTLKKWIDSRFSEPNKLCDFSDEIFEVSKKRNQAAHGSSVLPAQSLIDSKNFVYNKEYSQTLRNMLIRFMKLLK